MLFVITGYPQHGKSTFSQYLSNAMEVPWADTSSVVYTELAKDRNTTVDALRAMEKESIRPALIAKGDQLCEERGPAVLVEMLVEQGHGIVAGCRRLLEFGEVNVNDKFLIWIERAGVDHISDNTDPSLREYADLILKFDNGSFHDMQKAAETLARLVRL